MRTLTDAQLRALAEQRQANSVTMQIPTHRAGADTRQDPIALKNAIDEAAGQLEMLGTDENDAADRLAGARALLDDQEFMQHLDHGLVVCVDDTSTRVFRVPFTVRPLVKVGDRFQIKPLLRLAQGQDRFYILALSQNESRLLEATRDDARAVELLDAPASIEDLMRYVDEEKSLQFHTGGPASTTAEPRSVVFHGHGVGVDEKQQEKRIFEYCRMVDRSVREYIDDARATLVLAADERLISIYREANQHDGLVRDAIPGNPEQDDADALRAKAWPVVEPILLRPMSDARARFEQASANRLGMTDLEPVLLAAHDGQVEALFVASDEEQWGSLDEQHRCVRRHNDQQPGDDDLLDLAASSTLAHGGTVYTSPRESLPSEAPTAAILRYAVSPPGG